MPVEALTLTDMCFNLFYRTASDRDSCTEILFHYVCKKSKGKFHDKSYWELKQHKTVLNLFVTVILQ